jgi:hypothetical protein
MSKDREAGVQGAELAELSRRQLHINTKLSERKVEATECTNDIFQLAQPSQI